MISDTHWPASVAQLVAPGPARDPVISRKVKGHGYTFKNDAETDLGWGGV